MSKYTQRHYEDFALIIANNWEIEAPKLVAKIVELFEEDNPKFDRKLFFRRILQIRDYNLGKRS